MKLRARATIPALVLVLVLLTILSACDMGGEPPQSTPIASEPSATAIATTVAPATEGLPTATTPMQDIATEVPTAVTEAPTVAAVPTKVEVTPESTATGNAAPTEAVPTATPATSAASCEPTRADAEGPFYEPNAPVRSSVGTGHVMSGQVKSSRDCSPIAGATLEFWQVNPNAEYDDDHRATMFAARDGRYLFESNFPPGYSGRPPHIHLRVSAEGYRTLVTQYYPVAGNTEPTFDIVLIPE